MTVHFELLGMAFHGDYTRTERERNWIHLAGTLGLFSVRTQR